LAFVSARPARAAAPLVRGVVYHPSYGYVAYVYNPATRYVYLPRFGRGTYLPPTGGGSARPADAGAGPRRSILATRDLAGGSVVGGGYTAALRVFPIT